MIVPRAALIALLTVLLAGCTASPDAATPQPQPEPTTSPAPAPAATIAPDVRDRAFLDTLAARGVTLAGSAQVREAQGVCRALARGIDPADMLANYQRGGFTADEAGFFLGVAVAAYCPEHLHLVTE